MPCVLACTSLADKRYGDPVQACLVVFAGNRKGCMFGIPFVADKRDGDLCRGFASGRNGCLSPTFRLSPMEATRILAPDAQAFPFSLIDAMGDLAACRAQIQRELRYQSSLDLNPMTHSAIRCFPPTNLDRVLGAPRGAATRTTIIIWSHILARSQQKAAKQFKAWDDRACKERRLFGTKATCQRLSDVAGWKTGGGGTGTRECYQGMLAGHMAPHMACCMVARESGGGFVGTCRWRGIWYGWRGSSWWGVWTGT